MYHFWHRGTTFSDDDFQLTMILVEELGEVAVLGLSENVVALEIQTSWFPIFSYENCKFFSPLHGENHGKKPALTAPSPRSTLTST
jgi:hypothetical protein